jgi:hypothetical protein
LLPGRPAVWGSLDVSTTRLVGGEEPDGHVDNVISLTERQ